MIYVIAGPPGAGKTTYVNEHMTRGDVVVDVDALFVAVSNRALYDKPLAVLTYVLAARDAVVDKLALLQPSGAAYVITSSGKRSYLADLAERLQAELLVLDVDADTCKERLAADDRRDAETDWSALVDEWWTDYSDGERGVEMAELETRGWDGLLVELRAAEDGRRKILQRAVPYGELSVDLGGFREVIVAGAFPIDGDIRALWQHKSEMVLGRTVAGTLALRSEDDGIYAESDPPDTSWARDALTSIERGDVTGSSFGFYADEDEWVLTEREVIRRVLRGRLVEVSPVTFPAYPQTSAAVRSHAAELRAQLAAGGGTGQETGRNGDGGCAQTGGNDGTGARSETGPSDGTGTGQETGRNDGSGTGQETGRSASELERQARARGAARRRGLDILIREVDVR